MTAIIPGQDSTIDDEMIDERCDADAEHDDDKDGNKDEDAGLSCLNVAKCAVRGPIQLWNGQQL